MKWYETMLSWNVIEYMEITRWLKYCKIISAEHKSQIKYEYE